jgi:hypothetical protein
MAEQKHISDDFIEYWHEILPKRFGIIEGFNQEYVVKNCPKKFIRTLEIGCGLGEHLNYERLTEKQNYHAIDIHK